MKQVDRSSRCAVKRTVGGPTTIYIERAFDVAEIPGEPLAEIQTVADYAEWMKGMMSVLPDGRYEMKSFALDPERQSVAAYAVFYGTHTAEGGPVPPTGKSASTDYVYVMEFDGDKIRHLTKIWNAGWALRQLGWAD